MPRRRDDELLRRVGQRVARARQERGWTQERIAETVGIEPATMSRWETGDRALSLSTLAAIADCLELALGDLLDIERPIPQTELSPDDAELLRLFRGLPSSKRDIVLRLARDLSAT